MWNAASTDRWESDVATVYRTVDVGGWVVMIHDEPARWLMQDERLGIFRRFPNARDAMKAAERAAR